MHADKAETQGLLTLAESRLEFRRLALSTPLSFSSSPDFFPLFPTLSFLGFPVDTLSALDGRPRFRCGVPSAGAEVRFLPRGFGDALSSTPPCSSPSSSPSASDHTAPSASVTTSPLEKSFAFVGSLPPVSAFLQNCSSRLGESSKDSAGSRVLCALLYPFH
ncbi:uncharacterized protein FOMMEDRAFT_21140 [Fomitiporia mediterranea MF3/22]|uniref:uncharacterized protein n=1 Tax=Fomitiporia mediterranea (strain MF3/22) TaxID=694068 RepID=UPI0004407A5F|nr:uncharacterized protein FOMMEDRAFT_21140 [Fomitiporia mediterranea MF3/22]EJD02426.1 hypothetical protein FOMMEDRAFT_21140 [Fomitiporia mediterranea MF3/22]